MKRIHAAVIAVVLGVAAVAGTFAAIDTTSLGVEAATVSDAQIAQRQKRLVEAEKAIRRAAKQRPPALPPVPARQSGGSSGAILAAAPVAQGPVASRSGSGSGSGHRDDHDDDRDDDHDDDTDDTDDDTDHDESDDD